MLPAFRERKSPNLFPKIKKFKIKIVNAPCLYRERKLPNLFPKIEK
jgi:hypothetical protein